MALEPGRLREFLNAPLSTLELAEPTLVAPADPLGDVIARIRERDDSCAVVVEGEHLRGIITERDVLARCADDAQDWSQPVSAVMTEAPASLQEADRIADAVQLMRERDFRTVPIVAGDTVRGVVRLGDLLRHLAELFPEEVLNLPPRPDQRMPRPEGG